LNQKKRKEKPEEIEAQKLEKLELRDRVISKTYKAAGNFDRDWLKIGARQPHPEIIDIVQLKTHKNSVKRWYLLRQAPIPNKKSH
jgi:hypothetical protein